MLFKTVSILKPLSSFRYFVKIMSGQFLFDRPVSGLVCMPVSGNRGQLELASYKY